MIPEQTMILLSGIPATGKTSFGNYLAQNWGFAHYDLERFPDGWPRRELKHEWDTSLAVRGLSVSCAGITTASCSIGASPRAVTHG